MDATAFETWLGSIASLTDAQRQRVRQALFAAEVATGAGTEAVKPKPASAERDTGAAPLDATADPSDVASIAQHKVAVTGCPHCGQSDVVRWGRASGLPRYRCKACARTFNALTRTPLAKLRMKEKWSRQAEALIEGVSLAKAARRCDVHYTTAFRWRQRFLAALSGDKPKALSGIVESDETFILESFKGKRSGHARRASAVAPRRSGACLPSRSPSSSPAIVMAPQRMRCCRG